MSLLIASITPVMIFLYWIYQKDKMKEPFGLLVKCFFGGFLSLILALLIDYPLGLIEDGLGTPFLRSFYGSFIIAAIPEEFAKFVVLYWLVWRKKDFDQHFDGIIYAISVSLGFALVENIMYVFEGGMGVALMRAVLSVPGHGLFAVMMGYYFSLAKFHTGPDRNAFLLKSLWVPMLFHGLFDFALTYMSDPDTDPLLIIPLIVLFTAVVITMWRQGLKRIALHLQRDNEVSEMP